MASWMWKLGNQTTPFKQDIKIYVAMVLVVSGTHGGILGEHKYM